MKSTDMPKDKDILLVVVLPFLLIANEQTKLEIPSNSVPRNGLML